MTKITVDASLCTGCGLCASICPEIFEIGDDNIAKVIGTSSDCDINEAVSSCPVEAISIS